jgi:hypothetical protein
MALLEDTLGGWSGGILVSVAAIFVLPAVVPVLGSVVRPVVRTAVWGGLAIVDGVSAVIAEGYDQMSGLVAEARTELAGPRVGR